MKPNFIEIHKLGKQAKQLELNLFIRSTRQLMFVIVEIAESAEQLVYFKLYSIKAKLKCMSCELQFDIMMSKQRVAECVEFVYFYYF